MNQLKRYILLPSIVIFQLIVTLIAEPNSSFSLQSFDKNSNFALLGDAKIINEGNLVNLTSSSSGSSYGQIVFKKPFKLIDSISSKPISFSTDFTFTITPGGGDGVAFVIFPNAGDLNNVFGQGYFGLSEKFDGKFVAIEYDTRKDDNVRDLNGNHVGVDVGSFISTEISNVSSIGLKLDSGVPMKTWIDYNATSKKLNIRLSDSRSDKPSNPLISYPIDLSKMWEGSDVLVGITSSSGNSSQISSISSWSFIVSSTLHSGSLGTKDEVVSRRKNSCFLKVLGGVIFATGCGTMVAFLALFVWVIVFGRHSNVVPELGMNPVDFKYEKVNVTVDNVGDDDSTRLSTS